MRDRNAYGWEISDSPKKIQPRAQVTFVYIGNKADDGSLKKNLNASRPSAHFTQGGKCQNASFFFMWIFIYLFMFYPIKPKMHLLILVQKITNYHFFHFFINLMLDVYISRLAV